MTATERGAKKMIQGFAAVPKAIYSPSRPARNAWMLLHAHLVPTHQHLSAGHSHQLPIQGSRMAASIPAHRSQERAVSSFRAGI